MKHPPFVGIVIKIFDYTSGLCLISKNSWEKAREIK